MFCFRVGELLSQKLPFSPLKIGRNPKRKGLYSNHLMLHPEIHQKQGWKESTNISVVKRQSLPRCLGLYTKIVGSVCRLSMLMYGQPILVGDLMMGNRKHMFFLAVYHWKTVDLNFFWCFFHIGWSCFNGIGNVLEQSIGLLFFCCKLSPWYDKPWKDQSYETMVILEVASSDTAVQADPEWFH